MQFKIFKLHCVCVCSMCVCECSVCVFEGHEHAMTCEEHEHVTTRVEVKRQLSGVGPPFIMWDVEIALGCRS